MTAFVVAIALCYVLIKIPFWILGSVNISHGRSMLGSMAKAFLAYKTFGLAGAGAKKALGALSARTVPHSTGRGWTSPYQQTTWDSDGQGVLPLAGVGPSSWGPAARQAATARSQTSPEKAHRRELYAHPRREQGRQGSLLTRSGVATRLPPDRRRPPHPGVAREARAGEQTMLGIHTRYEPERRPRESVAEAMSSPASETPAVADESEQPRLFTADGRIRAHARPIKAGPGDVPTATLGQQQALNMRLRPTPEQPRRRARHLATPTSPAPDQPEAAPPPPRTKGQQPLLHQDGSINPRARSRGSVPARRRARQQARDQQRRRVQSAPAAPEFQPPAPPPATGRRGRTAPAPETAAGSRSSSARQPRSTRLNTPSPRSSRSSREATDE